MAKKAWKDPRGPHVRMYLDILDSNAWAVLSITARALYIEFRAKLGKTNNGDIECGLAGATKRGAFRSPTTLAAALFELRSVNLIAVTRSGGVFGGSRLPTLYRFCDEPYGEFNKEFGFRFGPGKATFKVTDLETLEDARAALETGVAKLHAEAKARNASSRKQEKTTLQKVERHAPDSVTKRPSNAPESVPKHPSNAPDSGVLLQLGCGAQTAKVRPGAKRAAGWLIGGEMVPRIACTVDCCPIPDCGALLGEVHTSGCQEEPCPVHAPAMWAACQCGFKEIGKRRRSCGLAPRKPKATVKKEQSHDRV